METVVGVLVGVFGVPIVVAVQEKSNKRRMRWGPGNSTLSLIHSLPMANAVDNDYREGLADADLALQFGMALEYAAQVLEMEVWKGVDAVVPQDRSKTPELPEELREVKLAEKVLGQEAPPWSKSAKADVRSAMMWAHDDMGSEKNREAMGVVRWWTEVSTVRVGEVRTDRYRRSDIASALRSARGRPRRNASRDSRSRR